MQPGLQSGVLVAQLEHGARLLQALVHIQLPPEGLLLLLQLPADTPWAGDRLFFALGMEDSSTAFTPAKTKHGDVNKTAEHKSLGDLCLLLWTPLSLGGGGTERLSCICFKSLSAEVSLVTVLL